jgi:hypothetical protein
MRTLKQALKAFYRIVFFKFTSWGRNNWKRDEMKDAFWAGL